MLRLFIARVLSSLGFLTSLIAISIIFIVPSIKPQIPRKRLLLQKKKPRKRRVSFSVPPPPPHTHTIRSSSSSSSATLVNNSPPKIRIPLPRFESADDSDASHLSSASSLRTFSASVKKALFNHKRQLSAPSLHDPPGRSSSDSSNYFPSESQTPTPKPSRVSFTPSFSRKPERRCSAPVPRTQPSGPPYYAPIPTPTDGSYASYLKTLPRFGDELTRSENDVPSLTRSSTTPAHAALGHGRPSRKVRSLSDDIKLS